MFLRAHKVNPTPQHIIVMGAESCSASPGPMHVWQTILRDITICSVEFLHVLIPSSISLHTIVITNKHYAHRLLVNACN